MELQAASWGLHLNLVYPWECFLYSKPFHYENHRNRRFRTATSTHQFKVNVSKNSLVFASLIFDYDPGELIGTFPVTLTTYHCNLLPPSPQFESGGALWVTCPGTHKNPEVPRTLVDGHGSCPSIP